MTKTIQLTDKQLLLFLKQKNERSLSYLYDHYGPAIYGVIVREVKNEKLASGILKNTFLNIIKECRDVDCLKPSLFTWLLALTKRTAYTDFNVNLQFTSLSESRTLKADISVQREFIRSPEYSPSSYLTA